MPVQLYTVRQRDGSIWGVPSGGAGGRRAKRAEGGALSVVCSPVGCTNLFILSGFRCDCYALGSASRF